MRIAKSLVDTKGRMVKGQREWPYLFILSDKTNSFGLVQSLSITLSKNKKRIKRKKERKKTVQSITQFKFSGTHTLTL